MNRTPIWRWFCAFGLLEPISPAAGRLLIAGKSAIEDIGGDLTNNFTRTADCHNARSGMRVSRLIVECFG